ncbi:amidohydrolase family protein [Mycobacterium sp. Aquia_213]|uniref:amidohydrolase family protein n=1 Tax=Mycobacterium sp. Aquia_213 TaxID=2991728 RepID=UPI00226F5843|nr:amidohydrolase family protein [Mycobacterium sp. Aquia_213]WAC91516.1 amidohydrolase family protein [Mycobacterium sp. Aquia_213]
MDIVDAQVHANMLGTEITLAIMDALGIAAVLFDEFDSFTAEGLLPGYRMANGAFRCVGPNAEAAAISHPDRFAFLMRVDPTDPGIESWVETLTAAPGFKAMRTTVFTPAEGAVFEEGGHDRLFKTAQAHGLPVFVTCPGRVPHLAHYLRRFPEVQFVIDHCGAAFDAAPGQASIDDALAMASHANVAYKWAHAASFLSTEPYPFGDLEPKLRRAVDAFGPQRVMWASDYTMTRHRATWAETLFNIRDSTSLSEDEKAWVLGGTARQILKWPAPQASS